jgi:magnesium transporter
MLYIILHFPSLGGTGARAEQEIDFLVSKHYLITAHYEVLDPLHSFAKAFEVETVLGHERTHLHGGHLFASMLERLYQALEDECQIVREQLSAAEERIFHGDEKRMVVELSRIGRTIHDFRQALIPHREMLSSFEAPAARIFGPEYTYYVRAIEAAYTKIDRTLQNLKGSLEELRETNNALLSTKQNEIMKILTIMAFVTFPLTLISSIFGMNTEYLPVVGLPGDFWFVLGGMTLLAITFFIFFKRKGWL